MHSASSNSAGSLSVDVGKDANRDAVPAGQALLMGEPASKKGKKKKEESRAREAGKSLQCKRALSPL